MTSTDFLIRQDLNVEALQSQSLSIRPLVAPISVEIGSLQFPTRMWTDFPAVILGWWMGEALALRGGTCLEIMFQFMEGPYTLAITVVHDDYWAAMPIIRGTTVKQGATYILRGSQVISELNRASREILRMCKMLEKWDKYCDSLEKLVQKAEVSTSES